MSPDAYLEMAAAQERHWWFRARRDILQSQIGALDLPVGADILEVGCGTGANLPMLARFGRVHGLDMSARALDLARAHCARAGTPIDLLHGRCPEDLAGLGRFDLVCLFDVLEHIADDAATLQRVAALLRPGGRVLLTVPAYPWMWSPHDERLHHQRRYTRASLARVIATSGLAESRLSHFNSLLFPAAVLERVAQRVTGRTGAGTRVPPAPINGLLAGVFRSERHLLPHVRLPWGLSLLAIAGRAPAA